MKLIIAGSRTLNPSLILIEALITEFDLRYPKEIVCGGAKGVDSRGEFYGQQNNIIIKRFPADWNKYGKSAGYKRNMQMAEYADALLLIWDGQSKGSGHMKDIMKKLDKPIFEVILKNRAKR